MRYDLFEYVNYSSPKNIIKHKKSIISHHAGFLKVESDPNIDKVSSGMLIKFNNLEPDCQYKLLVEAELISGDQAFVFIETLTARLVPRTYIFELNELRRYEIPFSLKTKEDVRIGILFEGKEMKYIVHITEFTLMGDASLGGRKPPP